MAMSFRLSGRDKRGSAKENNSLERSEKIYTQAIPTMQSSLGLCIDFSLSFEMTIFITSQYTIE
jgi:hypothetical protein